MLICGCVICPKKCLGTVKGMFGWFCGWFKGLFYRFCGQFKSRFGASCVGCFCGHYTCHNGLEGEGCYYLIGNNMLDNCYLMNVDICMLIY